MGPVAAPDFGEGGGGFSRKMVLLVK